MRSRFSRCFHHALALALGVVAMTCFVPAANAGDSPKITTDIKTTLTGSFFLNAGDQSEWIDFSGVLHLMIQATPPDPIIPPDPIRVHANMAGVTGIGRSTGQQYVLNGSENFEFDGTMPSTLNFQGTYRLTPEGPPIRLGPQGPPIVPIDFSVLVNESGVATSATATVSGNPTDGSPGN